VNAAAAWLYGQGHAVDLILAIVLIEAAWLIHWRGWSFSAAVLALLPGAILLLALRAALLGLGWRWIGLMLVLSFPAHLADVTVRDRATVAQRRGTRPPSRWLGGAGGHGF
jgi:hypothetical protein